MPAESLCSPASPLLAGLSPRAVYFGTGEFLPSTATLRRPGAVDTLERTSDGRVHANHTSDDGALEFDVDGWRYFTVSDCAGHVCLFFKSGVGHNDDAYIGGLFSSDGLRFGGAAAVVMPAMVPREAGRRVSLAHNLAILRHDGKWLKIGGQDNNRQSGKANVGLWALSADEWAWHHQRLPSALNVLNGSHPGCIERRDRLPYLRPLGGGDGPAPNGAARACEFDGRLSLAHFGGRFLLYARANPARHGQRFVQMTSAPSLRSTWSPFRPVAIDGYAPKEGNVYFFAVSPNPVDGGASLLALLPLVHRGGGCVALAASRDGVRWSRPASLLPCATDTEAQPFGGDRAIHQPAAGLVRRGDAVWVYVHENVPGVIEKSAAVVGAVRRGAPLADALPPSRLVRYDVPVARLETWTREALASIS